MDQSRRDMFKQLTQNKPVQLLKNWLLEKAEEITSLPDQFEPTAEAAGRALGRQHRRSKNALSWEALLAEIPDGKADTHGTNQNATQASAAPQPTTTETFPHE
jgi:hypothetical protein